jgi:hypothetical protein
MSLIDTVIEVVGDLGSPTLDEVYAELSGEGLNRKQVQGALHKGKQTGRLLHDGEGVARFSVAPDYVAPVKPDRQSITKAVAAVVKELGEATLDHLEPRFPNLTRKQIQHALGNGRDTDLVVCIRQDVASGFGKGKAPGVWASVERRRLETRPARWVFELGGVVGAATFAAME